MVRSLKRNFFERDTCTVAQELLGKVLYFQGKEVIINEAEAYHGFDDPASHAYRGKTKRTTVMFGEAGFSYVYFIYGMYYCLNIVTEAVDYPAAVLIRGGVLRDSQKDLNGPGKLCRELGINVSHNALDLVTEPDFYLEDIGLQVEFEVSPRIGIKQGLDKHWRYIAKLPPPKVLMPVKR